MKNLFGVLLCGVVVACGSGGSSGGSDTGGSNTGGSSDGGGPSNGGGPNGGGPSNGGGPAACTELGNDECSDCLEDNCCAVAEACLADTECAACAANGGPTCDANALFGDLFTCVDASCAMECGGGPGMNECNPVTNEPCAAGDACDASQDGFICFPPPNDSMLCDACDNMAGPFCAGGHGCYPETQKCAKYCCDDADCGTGTCDKEVLGGGEIGFCVQTATPTEPACDAPAVSPSMGSCFTL